MSSVAMQPKEFRKSAAECERLARESSDVVVQRYLTELAAELRNQATALEQQENVLPGKPRLPS
jgi:hypothetical protein